MRKRILLIGLIVLFIGSLGFLVSLTFGWISFTNTASGGVVSVGDLRFVKNGDFISSSEIIYPGKELLDSDISLVNQSTIDSQLRVKIEYTKITYSEPLLIETVVLSDSLEEHLIVGFVSGFVFDGDYWYYDGLSGVIEADSGLKTLITSIKYNGFYAGIDYAGQQVNVSIVIEVKQSDNVSWAELTTYDFSTGYPE